MASESKNDIAYAIKFFKITSWTIGVWPLPGHNVYSLIRCVLALFCSALLFILPCVEFYLGCTDAEINIECLMLSCCGILGILKTVFFRIYAKNLAHNYSSLINDYLTVENAKDHSIMRKHAFMGRIFCSFMVYFSYFSDITYGINSVLSGHKHANQTYNEEAAQYPIPSKCVMKCLNAPMSMFEILCFIQVIIFLQGSTANHGNDALFLNITLHLCGQVKILREKFLDFNVKDPHINDRFNVLIKRHKYLIKLAGELSETVNIVLLIQLFIISILLCIMGFQLIVQISTKNIILIMKNLMTQSTFLVQLTLYGTIGNYLKTEMEDVGISIYQSTWYNFPAKSMKHLVFIIMRSDTPVALMAGNFIVINLATYVSILKTSLSYLSVLRIMVQV